MYRSLLIILLVITSVYTSLIAQTQDQRLFIFGHSLLDHRPPAIPTPSDETTIPHWLAELAEAAGHTLAAGGQYGFLPQHARLPPISQWGYDNVAGVWESDTEAFSEADITAVIMTAGNFMQWQGPTEEYPSDPGVSPVSATEDIVDWTRAQEPGVRHYIYENWPDMAPYLGNGFPPAPQELVNYHVYTEEEFHQWWLDYQDAILTSRPAERVRMIPVGPVMSRVLTDLLADPIPVMELYEDDAPHGRPTIYFLASVITYMAIYEEPAPRDYTVPNTVHAMVRENYNQIVDYCWSELLAFNLPSGESRVFFDTPNSTEAPTAANQVKVYPNPTTDQLLVSQLASDSQVRLFDALGRVCQEIQVDVLEYVTIDMSTLAKGIYWLEVANQRQVRQLIKICRK